jgi:hypothetical protein
LSLRDRLQQELDDVSEVSTARQLSLLSRLRALEQFPEQDYFEDKTILVFEKKFTASSHSFTYVAVKMSGQWYLTGSVEGKGGGRFTWKNFVEWLACVGEPVAEVFRATAFELAMPEPQESQEPQRSRVRHCTVCGGEDHDKRSCPNG